MFARWFIGRSFRFTLSLAALVSLLAMLGLLVWQTWSLLETELRNHLRINVEQTNSLLASAVAVPLAQRDYGSLADIARDLVAQNNSINYIALEDHLGRRFAMEGLSSRDTLPAVSRDLDDASDGQVHIRQPILLAGQKLGEFQYGISLDLAEQARQAMTSRFVRLGLVGVLFGLLLLVPLGFWMTRRLNLLEAAAQRLAAGKLDERIDLPGEDELAHLAKAFNHMADNLAKMIVNLRDREARFHHAVEGSNDGIWDWDLERGEYYFSPRHKIMLGYRDDEPANDRSLLESLVLVEDRPRLDAVMRQHFEEREPFDCEFRMRHKDGHVIWCRSRGQAIWNAQGEVVRFSGATSDITEQKQVAVTLEHLAHYDPLTQLPNRTLLADRMAMALAQARRSGTRLAVALLDLDGFKPINDTHGHDVGDLILIEVASRLRNALREVDTVARLGGDEFVLVLSDSGTGLDYEHSLERVLDVLVRPYSIGEIKATLSGSIGVTIFPDDDADPDTLVRHADQAMYTAKQSGRNRYHVFDAIMDRDLQARLGARNRIIAALAADEFCLYYQPKVNLREGRVIGVEALIRWQHPERGIVPPAEFLPLIEDNDFTVQLSEWVIDSALTQMEAWQAQGLTLSVSVNLPARHLQETDFPGYLQGVLAAHPSISPDLFELEVLESTALEDVSGVSVRMQQCRDLGVRFSLDDFGTGYASLAYLRRLPIEMIKIDQSFVRDMLLDPDDLAIVEGVIGLAIAFRRAMIAEGCETLDHAVMLLHLGCHLVQGYGIARPMTPQEIPAWVADWRPDPALALATRHPLGRQDLALALVEVQHRRWLDFLVRCIEKGTKFPPEEVPLDSLACQFGQWLHNEGRRDYGDLAEYGAINAVHERVHALGRQLAELCASQKHEQACAQLPQLLADSTGLITRLHAMVDVVSRQGRRHG